MPLPNTMPLQTGLPNVGMARTSTANANRDGTGTLSTILTAGANGSKVARIFVKATATTTAGMIRLYKTDNAGANPRLFREYIVTAITPSASIKTWENEELIDDDIVGGCLIKGAPHNAEQFDFIISSWDY